MAPEMQADATDTINQNIFNTDPHSYLCGVSRSTSPSTVCAALTLLFVFPCSMDISALVHLHAEAVVIPACRIRHIYLLCFALMAFSFPRQLGAVDDSDESSDESDDEEMQLINDVASLDSQLKQAGCPCDVNLNVQLFQDLNAKPLAKRLKLRRFRKELLRQKLVASQLSRSAASGETAAASPPGIKQESQSAANSSRVIACY